MDKAHTGSLDCAGLLHAMRHTLQVRFSRANLLPVAHTTAAAVMRARPPAPPQIAAFDMPDEAVRTFFAMLDTDDDGRVRARIRAGTALPASAPADRLGGRRG